MTPPVVVPPPVPDHTMMLLNASISFALTAIIVVLLVRYIVTYNFAERFGHGLAGAAVFLSAFKQLGLAALMEPFNDWYQLLWRVGWLLLLGGKLWRLEKHSRANVQAVNQAADYLRSRSRR